MDVEARAELDAALEADRRLAAVHRRIQFLLNITPTNAEAACRSFRDGGHRGAPVFSYRALSFDPVDVKRELFEIDIDSVSDETLKYMLEEKRRELDRATTLLCDRDTPAFRHGSITLYGAPDDELMGQADAVLRWGPEELTDARYVSSSEFAALARAEIDRYRRIDREFDAGVEIREDVAGIMVLHGNLILGPDVRLSADRAVALVHHEIGTHVVTAYNGRRQPLALLSVGLPNYDEAQEALALFAEYAVGRLGPQRVKLLAGRVVAARRMIDDVAFAEVFAELVDQHGFDETSAWNTTMRAFRGGGTMKDVIYLRGLIRFLAYLGEGRPLEPLLIGKMPLEFVPLVEALLDAGILEEPAVRPRWLDVDGAPERIERARAGIELADLVTGRVP